MLPRGIGPIELCAGDFVLLPATPGFTLASDLTISPVLVAPTHGEEFRHGTKAGPAAMRMLGGYFRFDRANAQLLVKLLPSIVLIRRGEPGAARLRRIVELIGEETAARRPGRELILERLVEVLLVEALRFRPAAAARQEQGLLAGLADPALPARCDPSTRTWRAGGRWRSSRARAARPARSRARPPADALVVQGSRKEGSSRRLRATGQQAQSPKV